MTDVITASVSFLRQHVTRHRDNSLDRCQVTLVSWSKSKSDQNRTLHSRLSKESSCTSEWSNMLWGYAIFISHCESISFELTVHRGRAEKEKRLLPAPDPCEASTGSQGLGLIPVSHPLAETTDALISCFEKVEGYSRCSTRKKKILEASKNRSRDRKFINGICQKNLRTLGVY